MNHLLKRPLSLIMAILMVLSLIPATPVHVHAVDPIQSVSYSVDSSAEHKKGLEVTNSQTSKLQANTTYASYGIGKGGYIDLELTADAKDAFLNGLNNRVTIEVEVPNASPKTLKLQGGNSFDKLTTLTCTYTKPGTGSTIYVYELNNSMVNKGIVLRAGNTGDKNFFIRSVKITKGIDKTPLTDNSEDIKEKYCRAEIPAAIKVTNTSIFDKILFVKCTVTRAGAEKPIVANKTLKQGVPINSGAEAILLDFNEYSSAFSAYGTYTVHLFGYWNYDGPDNEINISVTFERQQNHIYIPGTVVPPTCTEDGYTPYKCACGGEIRGDTVPATGHDWDRSLGEGINHTAKCTNPGCTAQCAGDDFTYTPVEAGVSHTATCNVCEKSFENVSCIPQNKQWTNEETHHSNVCEACNATMSAEHSMDDWIPGETQSTRKCKYCDYSETCQEHAYPEQWTITETDHSKTCETCGYVNTNGHEFGGWAPYNADNHKRTCTVCEHIEYAGHQWSDWSDSGRSCEECNAKQTCAHNYGEFETVKEPSCDEKGKEQRTCSRCGEVDSRDVAALGCDWKKFEVVNPTCEKQGYTVYKCSRCQETKTDNYTNALNHNYEGAVTTRATCKEEGVMTYTCKNDASHTYTEPIPITGHTYDYVPAKAATCVADGWEAHYKCPDCEQYFNTNWELVKQISLKTYAKGHNLKWNYTDKQHREECQECEYYTNLGYHADYWQPATFDKPETCICGITRGDKKIAVAKIGEDRYETLTEAREAAGEGDTITLLEDQTVDVLSIDAGVTLDLNGKTVKARQVTSFGDIIDSSEDNTGRLIVADLKNSRIYNYNRQLPVKTKTGFAFVEVKNFNQKVKDAEAKYIFQPLFEEDAHDLLLADLEDTGVSIIVRVSWKYKGEAATHDFVFSDELVKAYIASYGEKTEGEYGKQFALTLKGTEQVTDLTFTAVVHSAGVEITSQVMSCPSNAEEAPSN